MIFVLDEDVALTKPGVHRIWEAEGDRVVALMMTSSLRYHGTPAQLSVPL
jgi:hypothetical protein